MVKRKKQSNERTLQEALKCKTSKPYLLFSKRYSPDQTFPSKSLIKVIKSTFTVPK
jgi:hypothetical protein